MALALPVTLTHVNKSALDDYVNGKTYKVMLCTDTIVAADDNISDLTEVAEANGYTAGGESVVMTVVQDGSAAYLVAAQPTFEASGGTIVYTGIAVYEVASGKIIAAFNEASAVTILSGATKTIQLNQLTGVLRWG